MSVSSEAEIRSISVLRNQEGANRMRTLRLTKEHSTARHFVSTSGHDVQHANTVQDVRADAD